MLLTHLYDKLFDSKQFLTAQYQFELKLLEMINLECPKHRESKEEYSNCVNKYKRPKTQYTNFVQLMIQQRQNALADILQQQCLKQNTIPAVRECMKAQIQKNAKVVQEKDIPFIVQLRKIMHQSIK